MSPLAYLLRALVTVYQWTLAPILGNNCRFEPSCSNFALEALSKHGAIRGGALTVWRILRCNPWGGAGWDPVPDARRPRHGCGHDHRRDHAAGDAGHGTGMVDRKY